MRLETTCPNSPEDADGGVREAVSVHRRKMRDLVNFTRDCDNNLHTDQFSARQMERLSRDEQLALSAVAEMPVASADDRRAKAVYLAKLIDADPECMRPDDLVAALLSLA